MEDSTARTELQAAASPFVCRCGGSAKWDRTYRERQGHRVVYTERLLCPCGAKTQYLLAATNGEHRQELAYLWVKVQAEGAAKCTTDTTTI